MIYYCHFEIIKFIKIIKYLKIGGNEYKKEFVFVEQLIEHLKKGLSLRNFNIDSESYEKYLKPLSLLTLKPVLYVCNINEKLINNNDQLLTNTLKHLEKENSKIFNHTKESVSSIFSAKLKHCTA